jgi:hypothetical protein
MALIDDLNRQYADLHVAKEDAFWTSMMGLSDDATEGRRQRERTEIAWNRFLQDPERLATVRRAVEAGDDDEAMRGWLRTLQAHAIEGADERALAEGIVQDEGKLAGARGAMSLGFVDPEDGFVEASSVALGAMLKADPDPARRKGAWDGLRSIEDHVLEHGFVDLVRRRNALGRKLGGADYYDWKTRRVEGMSKEAIFALLDDLEERTRDAGQRFLAGLREAGGDEAAEPWNVQAAAAGDVIAEQDPWFPFAASVRRWLASFSALGIDYRGAQVVIDLVQRAGKYENGFMHGPQPAWVNDGAFQAARIHFTANAVPGQVGSGQTATTTLFHEGGHAAHFANIAMPAPIFGQEFAPTSAAFAETQSMFLDSLLGDAAWQARYARDGAGNPMPRSLGERAVRAQQPMLALRTRSMLAICYAERAIYEIPDEQLSAEAIRAAIRREEQRILGMENGSPRPALSVPHLLSGEASAYYHAYVLASMALEQARGFFTARDGHLVDNPRIGPDLRDAWWKPGNSRTFVDLVGELVGTPSAEALARKIDRSVDQALADADASVAAMADVPMPDGPLSLGFGRLAVVHGNELIAEANGDADLPALADAFSAWIEGLEASA